MRLASVRQSVWRAIASQKTKKILAWRRLRSQRSLSPEKGESTAEFGEDQEVDREVDQEVVEEEGQEEGQDEGKEEDQERAIKAVLIVNQEVAKGAATDRDTAAIVDVAEPKNSQAAFLLPIP